MRTLALTGDSTADAGEKLSTTRIKTTKKILDKKYEAHRSAEDFELAKHLGIWCRQSYRECSQRSQWGCHCRLRVS